MVLVANPISSISLKYPSFRDKTLKTTKGWLDCKRNDDEAEGLWRVHNKLYDFEKFIKNHPGGAEWLELTKGTDITEQFETHHITGRAEQLLNKFFVRDATKPRNYKFTFNEDGFYRTLKRRVAKKIGSLDRSPEKTSIMFSDLMLGLVFTSAVLATKDDNVYLAALTGLFIFWQFVISHNFFHQKDNWRMRCGNLSLYDHREWRVTHVLSHHMYTNTYYDMEVVMCEPLLCWLPFPKKRLRKIFMTTMSPILWSLITTIGIIYRTIGYFKKEQKFYIDHLIPLSLPLTMYFFGKAEVFVVIKLWMIMIGASSFMSGFVGLNAGHHHPDVTHEGDQIESTNDFGIYQLNCVIDVKDVKSSHFWTLVSFGQHSLHHMFPTIDHGVLPQLQDTFMEVCREFDKDLREFNWWPLIKGQFRQLQRTEARTLKEMRLEK